MGLCHNAGFDDGTVGEGGFRGKVAHAFACVYMCLCVMAELM